MEHYTIYQPRHILMTMGVLGSVRSWSKPTLASVLSMITPYMTGASSELGKSYLLLQLRTDTN